MKKLKLKGIIDYEDNQIVEINNDIVLGKNKGIISLYTNGITYEVEVTDLISKQEINNYKPFVSCGQYTNEEAKKLDELLEYYIDQKGYGTRAGALEAARFLTLRFKNKLTYFHENGRLHPYNGSMKVDGEGRFYHKGLYLSEDKYDEIVVSRTGPAMWGCEIYEYREDKYVDFNFPNFI